MSRNAKVNRVLLGISLLALGGSPLLGCAPAAEPAPGNTQQNVLGGTAASAGQFPSVVAVSVGGGGLCTGTLVAPDLVLTAAHCVSPGISGLGTQDAVTANTSVIFDTANVFNPSPGAFSVRATWTGLTPFNRPGDADVGLIRLETPVTDRAPIAINFDPERSAVGTTVDFVGYGVNDFGNSGTAFFLKGKSAVTCANFGISDLNFMCFDQRAGSGICSGDSGGAAVAEIDGVPAVVSINSFVSGSGPDDMCTGLGAAFRTDAGRDWIKQNAPEVVCAKDGLCDPNCGENGEKVDSDCQPACVTDSDCDGDTVCDANACIPAPLSPGGLGSSCASGADCFTGQCAGAADDMRCISDCTEDSQCPGGFSCREASDGSAVCWEKSGGGCQAASGPGGLGVLLLTLGAVLAIRRRRRA